MFKDTGTRKTGNFHSIHNRSYRFSDPYDYGKFMETAIENTKCILLVDDDHAILGILGLCLTTLKFKVKSVDNAYDALDLFINEGFQLVLTDIQLPGMDGWELACNIKKKSPETPVIMMTGMEENQVKEEMRNGQADCVLFKPFNLDQLMDKVYGLLADHG
jgi:DNA-binding response OmpR family regulator